VDGRASMVTTWPVGKTVPLSLEPSRNEHLLEPVSGFPGRLKALLVSTTRIDGPGGAMRRAVSEVLLHDRRLAPRPDSPVLSSAGQRLVLRNTDWVPRAPELRPVLQASPTRASFEVPLAPAEVLSRSKAWVNQPDTEIGRFVGETLDRYLDENKVKPELFRRRLAVFENAFQAALDSAAPLVDLSPGVLGGVHHRHAAPHAVYVSGLPFKETTKAYDTAMRVLASRGVRDEAARRSFRDRKASYVDIFTVMNEPYEPVVFDSLMRPLAEEWGTRRVNADGRASFWRWRRTRPLPEFVPADPRVRLAMVRGWFTAKILGQLRTQPDGRTALLVPREGPAQWREFPFPTLTTARRTAPYDLLPIVLEALPLTFLEVNREATLSPLDPYQRLRRLGTSGDDGLERYEAPNTELYDWLLKGVVEPGSDEPPIADLDGSTAGLEERQNALRTYLSQLHSNYEALFRKADDRAEVNDVQLVWEMRDDVTNALGDLMRAESTVTVDMGEQW
ncbi:MAG: hypothetical protein ACM3ZF_06285, partial [Mycobacterium leprae]